MSGNCGGRHVVTNESFDGFLDDATHATAEAFEALGFAPLTIEQKYELNDMLDGFFSVLRRRQGK